MPPETQVATSSLLQIGRDFGFNALLVVILLGGMGWMIRAFLAALKEQREQCREERKEDRAEHIGAYAALTAEFKELRRELTPTHMQRLRGG